MRKYLLLFMLVLSFCMLSIVELAEAQALPQYATNHWVYQQGQDRQVVSIFPDSTYAMYWKHDSETNTSSNTCTSQVVASQGTVRISSGSATFTPRESYVINYPSCVTTGFDARVRQNTTEPFTLSFQLQGNTTLYLGNTMHNGYRTNLQAVNASPVGRWSWVYGSAGAVVSKEIIFNANGTYEENLLFGSNSCDARTVETVGSYQLDGMLLTLRPSSSDELTCLGTSGDGEMETKTFVVWMTRDDFNGYTLVMNDVDYTMASGSAPPPVQQPQRVPTAVPTSAGSDTTLDFYEDFSSNRNDWETGSAANYSARVANGAYMIDLSADSEGYGWFASPGFRNWSLAPQFSGSYAVGIIMRGSSNGTCGAGLLYAVEQGYEDGMKATYTPGSDAFWILQDMGTQDEEDLIVGSDMTTPNIDIFDGSAHSLELYIGSSQVSFQIDGQPIGSAMGQWETEGTIGLYVYCDPDSALHVELDDLMVLH